MDALWPSSWKRRKSCPNRGPPPAEAKRAAAAAPQPAAVCVFRGTVRRVRGPGKKSPRLLVVTTTRLVLTRLRLESVSWTAHASELDLVLYRVPPEDPSIVQFHLRLQSKEVLIFETDAGAPLPGGPLPAAAARLLHALQFVRSGFRAGPLPSELTADASFFEPVGDRRACAPDPRRCSPSLVGSNGDATTLTVTREEGESIGAQFDPKTLQLLSIEAGSPLARADGGMGFIGARLEAIDGTPEADIASALQAGVDGSTAHVFQFADPRNTLTVSRDSPCVPLGATFKKLRLSGVLDGSPAEACNAHLFLGRKLCAAAGHSVGSLADVLRRIECETAVSLTFEPLPNDDEASGDRAPHKPTPGLFNSPTMLPASAPQAQLRGSYTPPVISFSSQSKPTSPNPTSSSLALARKTLLDRRRRLSADPTIVVHAKVTPSPLDKSQPDSSKDITATALPVLSQAAGVTAAV
ncbi:hypothetical protein DIPPA_29457 [Diplonema papillatum]|nr:hypothetical protein DIPPA_29457 [Diplonema papillatum]